MTLLLSLPGSYAYSCLLVLMLELVLVLVLVPILKHALVLVLVLSHLVCLAESVGDMASGILSVVPVPKDPVRCVTSPDKGDEHQRRPLAPSMRPRKHLASSIVTETARAGLKAWPVFAEVS